MARVPMPESGLRARRRRRRALFLYATLFCVLLTVGGMVWLSHAPFMRIQTIRITGAQTVAVEAVERHAREVLTGAYWYVLPRDNIFLYPKQELAAALALSYPTLREIEIAAHDFNTITIEAVDREARALWCGKTIHTVESCLILDEDGLAYVSAPDFSGNPYVRYYGALARRDLPAPFLTPEEFRPLAALVDALAQKQHPDGVAGASVDDAGDVRLYFASGFALLFTLHDGGGDVFERFSLALTAEPFKNHSLAEFQYLDLRFGDRLYYKLKTESAPTP